MRRRTHDDEPYSVLRMLNFSRETNVNTRLLAPSLVVSVIEGNSVTDLAALSTCISRGMQIHVSAAIARMIKPNSICAM